MALVAREDWNEQAERLKKLLYEAGYPNAPVIIDDELGPGVTISVTQNGFETVYVTDDVVDRAFKLSRIGLRINEDTGD